MLPLGVNRSLSMQRMLGLTTCSPWNLCNASAGPLITRKRARGDVTQFPLQKLHATNTVQKIIAQQLIMRLFTGMAYCPEKSV